MTEDQYILYLLGCFFVGFMVGKFIIHCIAEFERWLSKRRK